MAKHAGRLELTWTDKDKALLSAGDGRYDYTFVDRADPRVREVRLLHEVDRVEAPIPEERPDDLPEPTRENLLITGDAMHVLDALSKTPEWAQKYVGKVKLVYIDPPFNTGQAFPQYEDNIEHSIWLTMLRDRLRQIKPLLASDGSVWVHLDDAEVHRCRAVMDEELGESNFIATIVWQKAYSPKNSAKYLSVDHDYILVYAKSADAWRPNDLGRSASMDAAYGNPDKDPRGPWKPGDLLANKPYSLGRYPITTPSGRELDGPPPGRYWRVSATKLREMDADGRIYWGADGSNVPAVKRFLSDVRGAVPRTMWFYSDVGHNQTAKNEIQSLFPGIDPFATPKPERLLHRIIHVATHPNDVVLDCFAGSGTTAAVAHKMGRRWITSELIADTASAFAKPRLTRVVDGDDPGGITKSTERVAATDAGLPEMTPAEAQEFGRLLGKVAKDRDDLDPATVRALRAATRTRDETTVTWHGGGGFTHLAVGPSMYDVDEDDGDVYLSTAATNGPWSQAVAAQLRFTLTPDHPVFCGARGRQRLAVIDGVADEIVVGTVVEHLGPKERAVIVAKVVLPEAESRLAQSAPGSRIKKAPRDLFPKRTVR
ncbi:MAG: site-specific DNA-methyltransferase [Solirubrobacteraceae bacterium]|nr:site-specific DNA-methyltransferase [Solirubrobacteraceae bacterium]